MATDIGTTAYTANVMGGGHPKFSSGNATTLSMSDDSTDQPFDLASLPSIFYRCHLFWHNVTVK